MCINNVITYRILIIHRAKKNKENMWTKLIKVTPKAIKIVYLIKSYTIFKILMH